MLGKQFVFLSYDKIFCIIIIFFYHSNNVVFIDNDKCLNINFFNMVKTFFYSFKVITFKFFIIKNYYIPFRLFISLFFFFFK